jgi:hypothetical protein
VKSVVIFFWGEILKNSHGQNSQQDKAYHEGKEVEKADRCCFDKSESPGLAEYFF